MWLTKIKRNENFNYKEVNKKEVPKERIEEGGLEYLNALLIISVNDYLACIGIKL